MSKNRACPQGMLSGQIVQVMIYLGSCGLSRLVLLAVLDKGTAVAVDSISPSSVSNFTSKTDWGVCALPEKDEFFRSSTCRS